MFLLLTSQGVLGYAGDSGAKLCQVTGKAMRMTDCIADASYVQVSEACLLKVSKDAPGQPDSAAMPDMRFTVLRRAKVFRSSYAHRIRCQCPCCEHLQRVAGKHASEGAWQMVLWCVEAV